MSNPRDVPKNATEEKEDLQKLTSDEILSFFESVISVSIGKFNGVEAAGNSLRKLLLGDLSLPTVNKVITTLENLATSFPLKTHFKDIISQKKFLDVTEKIIQDAKKIKTILDSDYEKEKQRQYDINQI